MKKSFLSLVLLSVLFMAASCASKGGTESASPTPNNAKAEQPKAEQPKAEQKPNQGAPTESGGPAPQEVSKTEQIEKEKIKEVELEKEKTASAPQSPMPAPLDQLGKVYFDFDRSDVRPEYRDVLVKDAETIKSMGVGGPRVVVEGHCDERGTAEYNLALGERRAFSVKKYLLTLGAPETSLYTISFGEEKPEDPGHNKAAWAKNRRVQFSKE